MTKNRHHRIDYIEFSVTDMAAARRFYSDIFGWEFNDYGPEYTGIRGVTGEVGGFALASQVVRGSTLVVLYSQDLESTLQAVIKAGATVSKEVFSFPGGRRFHFIDPCGNELAVWTEA